MNCIFCGKVYCPVDSLLYHGTGYMFEENQTFNYFQFKIYIGITNFIETIKIYNNGIPLAVLHSNGNIERYFHCESHSIQNILKEQFDILAASCLDKNFVDIHNISFGEWS